MCCFPTDEETGEAVPPEKALPLSLSTEGGRKLYTAEWFEAEEAVTIYRQTFSGRRFQEQPEQDANETRLEAAKRRLKELTGPRFFDLSRFRKLPWDLYFTPNGGMAEELVGPELAKPEPKQIPEDWDEADDENDRPEPAGDQPEEPSVPPEKLLTEKKLCDVLYRFSRDELERVEMSWSEGRLVLRRDGNKYACLYFENSFGRGDYWYAMLADPET